MTSRTRWLPALFGLAGTVGLSRAAFAAEPLPAAVRVTESIHRACPRAPTFFERLKEQLPHAHRALPGEAAVDVHVRVELSDGVSHGALTLLIRGAREERTASSRSCADVLAALSMMAAIVIGEDARAVAAKPSAAPPSSSPSRLPPPRARVRTPPRSKIRSKSARLALSAGTGAEINGNRGAVLLATWFVDVGFPAPLAPTFRFGLAHSSREHLSSPSGVVSIQWSEFAFAGCVAPFDKRHVRLGPCVNLEVGSLALSVAEPPPPRGFSYLWLTAGASGKVAWKLLRSLSVELAVGLRAPLVRSELFFEPDTVVAYRAPAIIPFGTAAFVAHLP